MNDKETLFIYSFEHNTEFFLCPPARPRQVYILDYLVGNPPELLVGKYRVFWCPGVPNREIRILGGNVGGWHPTQGTRSESVPVQT